jgi:exopolyphosphatase
MELSGILNATSELLFVDDPLIQNDMNTARVTLVDHNVLAEKFHGKNWTVVEIVDHHEDQGHYLQTCSRNERTIAFAHGKALVASACTLVAERLDQVWTPPYPPSVGLLLLGVILLDSVGLSKEVGKVTQRDVDAVAELLMNTDWQELPETTQNKLGIDTSLAPPDIDAVFDLLQGAKYDSHFWKSLSVNDCLRYDYKEFSFKSQLFGVSTVLMPLKDFFSKDNVGRGILLYMDQVQVDFLGIMFAFEDDGHLCRQLAFCGRNGFSLDDVDAFLHSSGYYRHPLDLKEIKDTPIVQDEHGLSLQYFDQRNVKPSRKQIGPILVEYFQSISNAEDQDLKDF